MAARVLRLAGGGGAGGLSILGARRRGGRAPPTPLGPRGSNWAGGPVFGAGARGSARGARNPFSWRLVRGHSTRLLSELPQYGAPPGLPCPTPRASAARGFNRLQGIVEDNPLSTGDHHGGPRSSVFGVPANQLPETSSCSPARRLATELRHRRGVVPSGGRRQAIYGCPSSSVGSHVLALKMASSPPRAAVAGARSRMRPGDRASR